MKKPIKKNIVFFICDILGLNILFRRIYSKKIRILMYHGVTAEKLPSFYWTQLPLTKFKAQMAILKKKYNVISFPSLLAEDMGGFNCSKDSVIITFDDGYKNIYYEAWPVLKELQFPATIFIVTNISKSENIIWTDLLYNMLIKKNVSEIDLSKFNLDKYLEDSNYNKKAIAIKNLKTKLKSFSEEDRNTVINYLLNMYPISEKEYFDIFKLLSVEQIKELSKSNVIQIASHTHNHPILSTLSPEKQEEEIISSLKQIESWGLRKSKIFAYPNGRNKDFNTHTINILKKNGIRAAVTTDDGFYTIGDNPFYIKRIPVGADMSNWEFKARLSGLYYFIAKIKDFIYK